MNFFSVHIGKARAEILKRALLVYLTWIAADFFFLVTRGEWRNYQQSQIWPVTLCYIWIVLHNVFIFKKLLFERRLYIWYIIVFVPSAVLFSMVYNWIIPSTQFERSLAYMTVYSAFLAFVGAAFFLAGHYYNEKRNANKLLILQKDIELKQLKSQLNPHFLFNSLNNIYSYNLENSAHGNDLILKLSNLMRFMVETSDKEVISLREELDFIDNYVSFERERLGYRCDITLTKNIKTDIIEIPPLLLFPLIENAFKHGANSISTRSKIEIEIDADTTRLQLIVRNSLGKTSSKSTRTGIPNIQRRLDILFPRRHEIEFSNEAGVFSATLSIDLSTSYEFNK